MSSAPTRLPLARLREVVPSHLDAFVCCASFEQRSLSIARQLRFHDVGTVLIAQNTALPGEFQQNAQSLHELFSGTVIDTFMSIDNPVMTADNLSAALSAMQLTASSRVLVDISTFTHEQLLILLALLHVRPYAQSVILVYTGADEYMLGEPKWLSRGISSIRSVLGYPGELHPSQNIHLLVLVGFELERAERLVQEYQPATISLGYADESESISPQHFHTNQTFHRMLSNRLGSVHSFSFSCRNALATKEAIIAQIAEFPNLAAVVAPLNTKVSTVGAALAAFDQPAIQLCYAQAGQYNHTGYSTPGDTFYVVDVSGFAIGSSSTG